MTGSRIFPGDKVLIRKEPSVESDQIALVLVNEEEATLNRVKYLDGTAIIYPDNPSYEPMIYSIRDIEIIGYVVQVIFNQYEKNIRYRPYRRYL
ncbi:Peptidase S24/S26A/S26B, conserved region (fragment) [Candidatus Desulfosporosinus infrequens]|uniref:Peptidase S24/S26A/S26B, conserved region n=1 Tax=Candidatus Desulfosporosinus infrequens TaxID=2043169 RepID=A0A2U3KUJ1_9FIRM